MTWCLSDTHVARDDCLEHLTWKMLGDLSVHLLAQCRTWIHHRHQHADAALLEPMAHRESGLAAAEFGGAAAKEQVDALMDKGKDLIDSAAELIRERPLASFGVAFAAGWIIAKLARGSSDK